MILLGLGIWQTTEALSSPEVDVYYSDTEAGYTLDGFQYKADSNEPDILPESLFFRRFCPKNLEIL